MPGLPVVFFAQKQRIVARFGGVAQDDAALYCGREKEPVNKEKQEKGVCCQTPKQECILEVHSFYHVRCTF